MILGLPVFSLTRPGLESMIYPTLDEHANHYTTNESTIYHTLDEHANHYTTNESTIYHTLDEHANHYTTNAVTTTILSTNKVTIMTVLN